MTQINLNENKSITWSWDHHFHELVLSMRVKYNSYGNIPEEEINKIRIPRDVAIAMVKELHDEIEFQEAYDANLETKGG